MTWLIWPRLHWVALFRLGSILLVKGQLRGSHFPGEAALTVLAKTQEGKHNRTSTFQGAACFIPANISLAEAGHIAEPQNQGAQQRVGRDTEGVKN